MSEASATFPAKEFAVRRKCFARGEYKLALVMLVLHRATIYYDTIMRLTSIGISPTLPFDDTNILPFDNSGRRPYDHTTIRPYDHTWVRPYDHTANSHTPI